MSETEVKAPELNVEEPSPANQQNFSNILKPTLHDNDFLQSFVRIGLDDGAEARHATFADEKHSKRKESFAASSGRQQQQDSNGENRRSSRPRVAYTTNRSVEEMLAEDLKQQKSRKRRRRKSDVHRQEEVYTDKDRAAAVNMGSRDIKQSLKLKRKQDRSKALQIPEEAEPSAMLALGTRELRVGNVSVALSCIDKALELSPNDKNALIARSRCHLLLGQPQKALDDAEAALGGRAKDPHNAKALFSKAEALYHLGDFELSLVFYYRGMKIRPEFDQFRLGVQKAKEAIQNILGHNTIALPKKSSSRNESRSHATETPDDVELASARTKTCSPLTVLGSDKSVDSGNNNRKTTGRQFNDSKTTTEGLRRTGSPKQNSSISSQQKRGLRNDSGLKRSNINQDMHLLAQLNADKRYLQNLVKRPVKRNSNMSEQSTNADSDKESRYGWIQGISGPVVVAERMHGSAMYELVRVGHEKLLGEVIRLDSDTATIQVYEDTTGLTYGDPVVRLERALSAELGPGLLSSIYDGIQRPLHRIGSIYVPKGLDLPALSRTKLWEFHPLKLRAGACLAGGDVLGYVYENRLLAHIATAGCYTVDEPIVELEYDETTSRQSMLQSWPVRRPRPFAEKLAYARPLLTGQRVLDALFPCAQGASVALPGAFGCGKTAVAQSLAKFSNSDVIVYVGCGERGNEVAEVLKDFAGLSLQVDDIREPIMKRTSIIANASNMPVAAREASIYTGITMAEYFRDQGFEVALMADSTSRWAEALREIGSRLGEMPGDAGYPAYLSARLGGFYERAGRARCLGCPTRDGSVSIVGVVSPPGGDLADPVICSTLNVVQTFWALDKGLAERKHFPAVNWSSSYSKCLGSLGDFYEANFPQFLDYRKRAMEILQRQGELDELVQLVGRGSLSDADRIVMDVARIITDDFIQQNAYTSYDRFCPFYKTFAMLRNIVSFYELAKQTTAAREDVAWEATKVKLTGVLRRLAIMKFLCPVVDGENVVAKELDLLYDDMQRIFEKLTNDNNVRVPLSMDLSWDFNDVKAAHQESAEHIIKHAEEGINFLKSRQEFWRQQQSTGSSSQAQKKL